MKKLSVILIFIFFSGIMFAQEAGPTWEGLKKQKEKSDIEITNPKKNIKSKTWIKRADTYFNISTFVLGGLYKGMPAKNSGIQNAEYLVGKPGKILKKGDTEVWVYNRKKLYFKNGILDHWEQTDFIDKDALTKSAEALLKAVELDKKGSLKEKTSTKDLNEMIKNSIINKAILKYTENDYDNAFTLMNYGYKLCQLPKPPKDTAYNEKQVQYFEGIIAFKAGKYDTAKKYFEKSIKDNYEPGSSYHYLATCYANEKNNDKFISTVKEGFEKYPDYEQLIIDLINYYMTRNEQDKAIEYINIAIEKNPDNPSYYSAKATIFDNKTDTLTKLYDKNMEQAYELKKKAFQNRNNSKVKAEFQKKRDAALAKAVEYFDQIETNLAKAEKLYNKSLEINPKFFNASYNIGRLYLKRNDINAKHSDWLLKVFINKDFNRSAIYETTAKDYLKTAAQKFENTLKIKPEDRDLLGVLKRIYYKLHDQANLKRITDMIENLGAEKKTID
ncbi:MAG: tetratricopeptide repeat protein [Chlorobi bacterium]|nr:tetratricopeptide repeat protein [Chlorobiota bacterium]